MELSWIDVALGVLSFGILWYLAGFAGWYHEILRVTLILVAIELVGMWWLRHG
jgi:hypothetical protein